MSLRLLLQTLQKKCNTHLMKFRKTSEIQKSNTMEPATKKQKFVPEECELMIEINKRGECKFDIISKVESICDENLDKKLSFPSSKNTEAGTYTQSNDTDESKGVSKDDHKNCDDNGTQIPPISKYVALDCEFVGVRGDISALGRCSIVDYKLDVICDIYAQPNETITRYRTPWSGITKSHMKHAIPLESALSQISDIIQDKIVVGHGIHNDFRVLGFGHPDHLIRDTQKCSFLLDKMKQSSDSNQSVSLKNMALKLLGKHIQTGAHCSVIDATVTMELFKLVRKKWETSLLKNGRRPSTPDDSDNTDESVDIKHENNEPCSKGSEPSNKVDHMATMTGLLNGRISKKRKRSKKRNGFKAHFGQIIAGGKSLTDYFKEDKTVSSNGKSSLSDFLKNKLIGDKTANTDNSNNTVSKERRETSMELPSEICNSMSLRDGKTYTCVSVDPRRKINMKPLKKTKTMSKDSSEKITLKTRYAENIKQLFHDDFWTDEHLSSEAESTTVQI